MFGSPVGCALEVEEVEEVVILEESKVSVIWRRI